MHDYKKYVRSFIIMTPESSGYAAEGQKLTGTALLEIRNSKGTLTVNIHGLKAVGGAVYKLYLISSGDGGTLGIPCGIITPAERGKTVKTWEFDPLSVGGSGIECADFNVIALIAKNVDLAHNEITAPLVGYLHGTVIWKSGFKEYQTGEARHVNKAGVDEAPAPVQVRDAMPNESVAESFVAENAEESNTISNAEVVTEAPSPAASAPILAIEPAPLEEYTVADGDYIFERIITGAPQCDSVSGICRKIEPFLPQNLRDKTEPMFHRLKETLPEDKFGSLVTLAEAVTEYVPVEVGEQTSRLIAEIAENGGQEARHELFGIIGEYAPGKVMDSLIEASEYSFPYLGGFGTLPSVLEGIAKSGFGTGEHKIKLKSGLTEPFTLREPSPGEDHNSRFKETLHSFAEQSADQKGKQNEAQGVGDGIQVAEGGELHSEANAHKRGNREGFDEAKLLKFFDGRQGIFPFKESLREEEHGHHHPPHAPHVPPIYKMRWITIGENDFGLLPIESLKYINNPFAVLSFKSYRHYILGVSGRGPRQDFYLGVPGTYSERSRATATSLGFESFMPVSGGRPWHGDFGYWLVEL